jgi:hypothetical protein
MITDHTVILLTTAIGTSVQVQPNCHSTCNSRLNLMFYKRRSHRRWKAASSTARAALEVSYRFSVSAQLIYHHKNIYLRSYLSHSATQHTIFIATQILQAA